MDDEDLAELRDSRQLVDENDEMDFGGTEAELRRRAGDDEAEDECVPRRVYLFAHGNSHHLMQHHGERSGGFTGSSGARLCWSAHLEEDGVEGWARDWAEDHV